MSLQNNYQEAIVKFRKAIESSANYAYPYALWGDALARQQKHDEANAIIQKILAMSPNSAPIFRIWGDALLRQQQYAEAKNKYQHAIALQPDRVDVYSEYAWRLATSPDDNFRDGAKALSLAQKALELFGQERGGGIWFIEILDTIAAAYAELGQFDEAVKTMEKIQPDQKLTRKQAEHFAHYKNHQPVREAF